MHKKWGEKKEVQKKEKKRLKMGGVKGGPKRKLWIAEIPKTTAVANKEGGMGTMQVNWRTYPSILTLFFQCSFLCFCFFVYLFGSFFLFPLLKKRCAGSVRLPLSKLSILPLLLFLLLFFRVCMCIAILACLFLFWLSNRECWVC